MSVRGSRTLPAPLPPALRRGARSFPGSLGFWPSFQTTGHAKVGESPGVCSHECAQPAEQKHHGHAVGAQLGVAGAH